MNDIKQNENKRDHLLGMSAGELNLLRYTIVTFAAAVLICLIAFAIWVLSQIVSTLQVLIFPLAVAAVLALILFPLVEAFEKYLRVSRLTAVITLFLILSLLLLVGLVLVIPIAVTQGSEFAKYFPGMIEQAYSSLLARFPTLIPLIQNVIAQIEPQAVLPEAQEAADKTMGYISLIVVLGFVPLYLFFALLSGERIRYNAKSLLFIFHVETQDEVLYLGQVFVNYMTAFFRGQLVIALSMGVMMAAGFTIIGLNGAIFFGMALGLLSIVPYLGMIIGLLTVLPVAYIQPDGGFQLALLVLGVIIITQIIESILLTPKIMADKSGLHPVLVVVSILFWGKVLGGITGMILAVPLTAFLLTLGRHLKLRLYRPDRPGTIDPGP